MEAQDLIKLLDNDPRNKTTSIVENVLKFQYPLYNLFIEFPTAPSVPGVEGGNLFKAVTFPAYISSPITDTFTPTYSDAGPVFGRMDPIPVYSKTTRTIKVDFNIPANDINDAREIRGKLDIIAKNTYPTYKKGSSLVDRLTIYKPPLIRIKFGNIICNPIDQFKGLLGYLNSGISISHDLAGGAFTTWPGQEIYAKKYSLSLSMNVLHEFTPGFVTQNGTQVGGGTGDIPAQGTNNFLRPNAVLSFPGSYIIARDSAMQGQSAQYILAQTEKDRIDIAAKALGLK